jgi:predicted short-subunit dehydrogenase-like oxidoreductase (DUF2520 family)
MVGSIIGRLLAESGTPPAIVASRTPASARRAARFSGAAFATSDLARLPAVTRLIVIATPHDAIEPVARALARLPQLERARLFVCHTSGMLTAAALEPLARLGARVFSFHPLQSFPRIFRPAALLASARGITYGIDGPDASLSMARQLARRLGGRTVVVPPHLRTYYHAASVVASTHLAALTSILAEMFSRLRPTASPRPKNTKNTRSTSNTSNGKDFYAAYEPLLQGTLALVKARAPRLAIGGAIARGGLETLEAHLRAVATHSPDLVLPFSALCLRAIALAGEGGAVAGERVEAMRRAVVRVALETRDLDLESP